MSMVPRGVINEVKMDITTRLEISEMTNVVVSYPLRQLRNLPKIRSVDNGVLDLSNKNLNEEIVKEQKISRQRLSEDRKMEHVDADRINIIPCNLKESLAALCLNGGVCWKATFRGSLRCLCQPLFYGQNCELHRNLLLNSIKSDADSEAVKKLRFRGENRRDPLDGNRSRDSTNFSKTVIHSCSPSESKGSGCQNNSKCIKVYQGDNKYEYKCRCLPPFFGSYCNLSHVRRDEQHPQVYFNGIIALFVVSLFLVAVLMVLFYLVTKKSPQTTTKILSLRKKWRGKKEHTLRSKRNENLRNNPISFDDLKMTTGTEFPKVIFYNTPPSGVVSRIVPYRGRDFTWYNNNHDRQRTANRLRTLEKDAIRYHGNERSLDSSLTDDLKEVIFDDGINETR